MAITMRKGQYVDFDPSKLRAGEWAVVLANDPGAKDGKTIYICFTAGNVKRMATYEDMVENIRNATDDIRDEYIAIFNEIKAAMEILKNKTEEYKNIAETKASEAANSAATATQKANAAATSATNAANSATSAAGSAATATTKASEASTSAANAKTSETKAKTSETNAKTSETNAKTSETNAAASATTATQKANAAATSATNAANSATSAAGSATTATNKANAAATSATNAATSATNADTYAKKSQSYAVGTGNVRPNEATDSAKYYYEQAKSISEGLAGALMPMGTVTFANLPALANTESGWMYNISDQFTTNANFKEGAGNVIPAGANVYKTADGKWDVLAGTPVTGIKGNTESTYRQGNVNLTPANVGAVNKAGDTMTGKLNAHGGMSLNSSTTSSTLQYLLGVDSYSAGGTVHYQEASSVTVGNATNADTVDGKHASDLQNYNNLSNKPTIPPVYGKTINASFSTQFRTQTKGNNSAGDYISNIRNDTDSVANSPQYGSGLAFGRADTHGYLYVNYSGASAYIGGGNGDKLNWIKELAFKDSIPSVGNGTVTIKQAGTNKGSFTMNQSGNTTIELTDNNTDTNTWRPVEDVLTSTSTTNCLSANMGRVLNNNLSGKQDKIVVEHKTIKTTADYYVATKSGYTLLNAYTVRDDVSYYVKAIQKRSGTDSYTVIFDNIGNGSTLSVWIVWAKHD